MQQPTPQGAKIQALEGLRGVMSWWVVLGHISLTFGWGLFLIDRNTLAVDVFIMLSGFVIFRLIDRKQEIYSRFITRRAFRIFPLYLVLLAISTLLAKVGNDAFRDIPFHNAVNSHRIELTGKTLDHLGANLLAHIPLLQGLVPNSVMKDAAYTIMGQVWSVSLEWQFYLLAPLIFFCLMRPRLWLPVLAGTAILFALKGHFSNAFLGAKIFPFLVGMCSYLAMDVRRFRLHYAALAILAGLAEIAMGGKWQVVPLAIWAAVLLSAMSPAHSLWHLPARALASRALVHFGNTSYSVYLIHMIPVVCSIALLNHWHASPALYGPIVLFSGVAITYLFARMSWHYIEKPGIDAGTALAERMTVAR